MSLKQAKQQINEEIIKESLALIEDIPVNNENKSLFITEIGKLKNTSSSQIDFTAWMALFQIDVGISQPSSILRLKPTAISNLILLNDLIIE